MEDLSLEKSLKLGLALMVLATLALGAWIACTWRSQSEAEKLGLVSMGRAPEFTLVDQDGRPFDSDALKGKVWAVSFIYTRCATSCPLITDQMAQLGKRWAKEPDFRMLSITVDPMHDSPKVLLDYAKGFQADPKAWTFLTGPPDQVYTLIEKGFLASVERLSVDEKGVQVDIPHSTNVEIVDRQGEIRGVFEGVLEPDWTRMDKAIGVLLKE
ncbi:MAG TPA: SCO family protein [bacterium]|jgi:cytochrome oxidase Cu insertion factor (SCO1/SenC/PrrC family)|nr:SCO family protein [bacterium]